MVYKQYNKNLHVAVLKFLQTVGVKLPITQEIENTIYQNNVCFVVYVRDPSMGSYKGYTWIHLYVYFNTVPDPEANHGRRHKDGAFGYNIWGFIKNDGSDFDPSDFFHYLPHKVGEEEEIANYWGLWDDPEADQTFKGLINSLEDFERGETAFKSHYSKANLVRTL